VSIEPLKAVHKERSDAERPHGRPFRVKAPWGRIIPLGSTK